MPPWARRSAWRPRRWSATWRSHGRLSPWMCRGWWAAKTRPGRPGGTWAWRRAVGPAAAGRRLRAARGRTRPSTRGPSSSRATAPPTSCRLAGRAAPARAERRTARAARASLARPGPAPPARPTSSATAWTRSWPPYRPGERNVLRLRYGLAAPGGHTMTLLDISAAYGVTTERIRQIEDSGLRRLRDPLRAAGVRDAADLMATASAGGVAGARRVCHDRRPAWRGGGPGDVLRGMGKWRGGRRQAAGGGAGRETEIVVERLRKKRRRRGHNGRPPQFLASRTPSLSHTHALTSPCSPSVCAWAQPPPACRPDAWPGRRRRRLLVAAARLASWPHFQPPRAGQHPVRRHQGRRRWIVSLFREVVGERGARRACKLCARTLPKLSHAAPPGGRRLA